MKKSVNKKSYIWIIFLLSIIFLNLVLISAQSFQAYSYPSWLSKDSFKQFYVDTFKNLFQTEDPIQIFICIIVSVIFYGVIYDALELASILQSTWLKVFISVGTALVAILLSWPITIVKTGLELFASFGAFGIFFELLVVGGVFIGLILGSSGIAKWAAKRKGNAAIVRSIKVAGDVKGAIAGLKEIESELK